VTRYVQKDAASFRASSRSISDLTSPHKKFVVLSRLQRYVWDQTMVMRLLVEILLEVHIRAAIRHRRVIA
jgi:hypothetical protein